MAIDAAVQVESSPTEILASLTPAETAKWRQTGDLPEPKEPPKEKKTDTAVADSSSAAKTEVTEAPAKAPEVSAESAPAKTERPKHNAETRIPELLADRKARDARIAELEKKVSELSTPSPKAEVKEAVAEPQRWDVDEKGQSKFASGAAGDEECRRAQIEWAVDQRLAHRDKEQTEAREKQKLDAINKKLGELWNKTEAEVIAEHPDYKEATKNPEFQKALKEDAIFYGRVIKAGAAMAYFFATHPDELERIKNIEDKFDRSDELYELGKSLQKKPADIKPTAKVEAVPPTSKVTSAPAPATSVSGKATAPVDEINAALTSEDFKRYQEAGNAEDYRRKKKS